MFFLAVSAFSFVSCSDDDDNDNYGENANGEFFEITINGNTRIFPLESTTVSSSFPYSFIQSEETYPVEFLLTYYSNLEKVANAKVGNYRFCPDGYPQNFDFDISYNLDDSYLFGRNGVHTITSIKNVGDEVLIEGTFSGTFSGNIPGVLEVDLPFSGRYRIVLY